MEQINIMDLNVDVLTSEALTGQIQQYCKEESINSVLMLTDKILERAAEDEKYHKMVSKFSMRLPAAEEVLVNCHLTHLKNKGILTDYNSFYSILHCLEEEQKSIYLVCNDLEQIERFQMFCEQSYCALNMVGSCYKDGKTKDETIVNEINTILPDVVIVALKSPEQEKWMIEQGPKLSIKLCIGTGNAFTDIVTNGALQKKKLKKWKLYQTLKDVKRSIQKIWHKRIIQNECEYYIYKRKKSRL